MPMQSKAGPITPVEQLAEGWSVFPLPLRWKRPAGRKNLYNNWPRAKNPDGPCDLCGEVYGVAKIGDEYYRTVCERCATGAAKLLIEMANWNAKSREDWAPGWICFRRKEMYIWAHPQTGTVKMFRNWEHFRSIHNFAGDSNP